MTIKATPFNWNRLANEEAIQRTLEPSDPRHWGMFAISAETASVILFWGGYEYMFDLDGLDTPMKLLAFVEHVSGKTWEHTTPDRIGRLISAIALHFGWDLHGWTPEPPRARTTSAAQEREKLTPKLRYDVLLRDDFKCRACGFSVESGAHLHIDHIKPVSAGGTTEFNNLQALCSVCNQGKGSRK